MRIEGWDIVTSTAQKYGFDSNPLHDVSVNIIHRLEL